jgi:beta-1,4-mannosyltransferase
MSLGRVRVASVPATHVYVRHLEHPRVERVTDPSGDDLRTPCFLDPGWWRAHGAAADLDVLHVHFGFEYYDPAQLEAVCDEVARAGVALVHTCHDLRNPNHPTPELHTRGLDVWLRRADEIVTLSDTAARAIRSGWGRAATVLAHPHVVPLDELAWRASRPRRVHPDRFRILLHLKSLRANMFGRDVVEAALDTVRPLDGVRLRVDVHHDVLDPSASVHEPALAQLLWTVAGDAASPLDLHVHHYLSDDELWDLLGGVDAFVLPYRFGTHSGLLEACRDLGTAVIAPRTGGYADQGAHHLFDVDADGTLDRSSFASAVREAVRAGRPEPLPVTARASERDAIAEAHVRVYDRALHAVRRRATA